MVPIGSRILRRKTGEPKLKALRRMPSYTHGLRDNPQLRTILNPQVSRGESPWPRAIDTLSFFAGCGGLDLGALGGFRFRSKYYEPLPIRILGAYDNDERAVDTYRLNIGPHADVVDLTGVNPASLPKADLLLGGFPCQDFSSCGHKRGFEGSRGLLYRCMVEYMRVHQPKVVVGENVPLLRGMKNGELLKTIVADLEEVGYRVSEWYLNCPDYGLPASRKRIFLVCVRNDLNGVPALPKPTHVMRHVSIDAAIDDLKEVKDESVPNQSQYFVATKATAGAGQGDQKSIRGQLAFAVRANAKARVHFHYDLDRRLTVRELARLQSFPDEFIFPHAAGHNVMQIGNAVPPIVGHAVIGSIVNFLLHESSLASIPPARVAAE